MFWVLFFFFFFRTIFWDSENFFRVLENFFSTFPGKFFEKIFQSPWKNFRDSEKFYTIFSKKVLFSALEKKSPSVGIEPTAIGLKGQRSTIWAKKAHLLKERALCFCPLKISVVVYKIKKKGPTGIWTRIAGFRVQSDNHYTIGPRISLKHPWWDSNPQSHP